MAESVAFARREFLGGAVLAKIPGGLNAGVTGVINLDDLATWVGATTDGPTYVFLDRLGSNPEMIQITAVSGNTFTIPAGGRGLQGTADANHDPDVTAEISSAPRDFDEANRLVNLFLGVGSVVAGDLFYVSAASGGVPTALSRIPKGTAGQSLRMNAAATAPEWVAIQKAVRKAADESVTSSTTLQDDNELTFTIAANEIWTYQIWLKIAVGALAADGKYAITVPAGATKVDGILTLDVAATGGVGNLNAFGGGGGAFAVDNTFETNLLINGTVSNGATPGSVTLQWAQNASSATATTVKAGSFLVAHRVA